MDRSAWDERYAQQESVWGGSANVFVVRALEARVPGRALDLACGEGRNALWLAELGWRVTAVDFSAVALAKGRAQADAAGVSVDWVEADVTEFQPEAGAFDAVVIAYLQLPVTVVKPVIARAAAAVAPRGVLIVVSHDAANLAEGVGGPQDPSVLHTVPQLVDAVAPLTVVQAERVERRVPGADRPALDALVVATRPGPAPQDSGHQVAD